VVKFIASILLKLDKFVDNVYRLKLYRVQHQVRPNIWNW